MIFAEFCPNTPGQLSPIIRFRARGLLEMCWHLFTWGGAREVVEPPELVRMMDEHLDMWTARMAMEGINING